MGGPSPDDGNVSNHSSSSAKNQEASASRRVTGLRMRIVPHGAHETVRSHKSPCMLIVSLAVPPCLRTSALRNSTTFLNDSCELTRLKVKTFRLHGTPLRLRFEQCLH